MELRIRTGLDTGRGRARRKTCVLEVEGGASKRASEIVLGLGVTARKAGTTEPQDGLDLGGRYTATEQLFGDPEVGGAPIGVGEASRDAQAVEEALIDGGGGRGPDGGDHRRRRGLGLASGLVARGGDGLGERWREPALSGLDQRDAVGCPLRLGVEESDPGSVAAGLAAGWFLIGEASQSSQMAPVGAGRVAAIEVCQVLADGGGQGGRERGLAEANPGLEMTGTGLHDDAGLVSVGAHSLQRAGGGSVQIQQDVAGVLFLGIGSDVDVKSFAVTEAQEADHGTTGKLERGPKRLCGEGLSCLGMNQSEQKEVIGHGRELSANGLQGDEESALHDRV